MIFALPGTTSSVSRLSRLSSRSGIEPVTSCTERCSAPKCLPIPPSSSSIQANSFSSQMSWINLVRLRLFYPHVVPMQPRDSGLLSLAGQGYLHGARNHDNHPASRELHSRSGWDRSSDIVLPFSIGRSTREPRRRRATGSSRLPPFASLCPESMLRLPS